MNVNSKEIIGRRLDTLPAKNSNITFEVSRKFLIYRSMLPDSKTAGLEFVPVSIGSIELFFVAEKKSSLNRDDLEMIFKDYAQITCSTFPNALFSEKKRRVYALANAKDDPSGRTNEVDYHRLKELFQQMIESNIRMRITAGRILFSTPDKMQLKDRMLISMVFSGSVVRPAEKVSDKERYRINDSEDYFTGKLLYSFSDIFVEIEDDDSLDELLEDEIDLNINCLVEDDDIEDTDEKEEPVSKTPILIEKMELSVRTYNCLKRANINDSEQLSRLSYDDLIKIRNLGKKSADEVLAKLKSLNIELSAEPVKEKESAMKELDALIGLEDVKEQVRKIAAFARMKKAMSESGSLTLPMTLNTCFMGNPGTAKTTVARILSKIFCEIGLLKSSEIVEVGRADLVACYVGQTAPKVRDVFKKAKGKVLFIDEAYSLADSDSRGFGDEAICTIVQEMENHRDETIVIFAGYPDEMSEFFDRNPGLRSRVPFNIEFKDYAADVLVKITELEASKRNFSIDPDALDKVHDICGEASKHPGFGNGRFCRNLIENAILDFACRNFQSDDPAKAPKAYVLTAENFIMPPVVKKTEPEKHFGFDIGEAV